MAFLTSFASSQGSSNLQETDFFDRLEKATENELNNILKEGQNHYNQLGRFGLADRIAVNCLVNQSFNLKPRF